MWDLFLSHAWADGTHDRVRALCHALILLGWSVWFDENTLTGLRRGSLDQQLMQGLSQSSFVCVCLTSAYCEKLRAHDAGRFTNVGKEFHFSTVARRQILPLVFERELLDTSTWNCTAQLYIGNHLYVDLTHGDMELGARQISQMLYSCGKLPRHKPISALRKRNRIYL